MASEGYLTFAYENIGYVVDGQEEATVRLDLERSFDTGDVVELRTPTGKTFGHARIKHGARKEVHEAVEYIRGHGVPYPSDHQGELIASLEKHYEVGVSPFDVVTVVFFEVLAFVRPPELRVPPDQRDAIGRDA